MCLYPKLIKNKKYIANKKNGGVIPHCDDERKKYVPRGCENCIECRKQKARSWQLRLLEEIRHNKNGKFITLTFNTESLRELSGKINGLTGYNLDNEIATKAIRYFNERWRKKNKKALRHWLITELGHEQTEHLHLHGIVWTDETYEELQQKWQYGYIWPRKEQQKTNFVNEKTVNYLIKYVTKIDKTHEYYKPRIFTSPGMGNQYTTRADSKNNTYKGENTKETYITRTGHKIAIPTYWRNKIYTEEEREKLWVIKLDKNERWVLGQKIDISKDEKLYYKVLEEAQQKNKRLGYGNDEIDWEKRNYENERRRLKMAERTERPADTHEPSPAITPCSSYKEKENELHRSKEWE